MTQVRKIAEVVNNGLAIKDWKNKTLDIIRQNYRDEIPSEETIICYAADLIQDYHNTKKDGHLWADNRDVTDSDVSDFAKIVIAILAGYGQLSDYENADDSIVGIEAKLRQEMAANAAASQKDED